MRGSNQTSNYLYIEKSAPISSRAIYVSPAPSFMEEGMCRKYVWERKLQSSIKEKINLKYACEHTYAYTNYPRIFISQVTFYREGT
jgi:hypothetical protein